MEQNKYYTPDITDLRIGYECFVNTSVGNIVSLNMDTQETKTFEFPDNWKKHTIVLEDLKHLEELDIANIKTSYLTKEQIEAEGWKEKVEYTGTLRYIFEKGNSWLSFNPESRKICIVPIDPVQEFYEHRFRYAGNCPSINEFRIIQKLLEI